MVIKAVVTRPFYKASKFFVLGVIFVASIIAGSHLYAQNEDAPKGKDISDQPGVKQHGEQNDDDPMDKKRSGSPQEVSQPVDMADHMSKMLTERLRLTGDQKTKVYDIVLAYASSHNNSDFDHNELDGKIEVVLNADQKDKFKEFIKNGPNRNAPPSEGNDVQPGINK